ncbi:MAG: TonB-dependent receptor family protein [Bacteroides sp.]|nr:TonB-dependent receptor family protein [Bacteroides sp.]MCM1447582.1 TonB-dependent receptor family protein [Bacteroides sp.]MCM1516814.1 TonB-dependent receptor family protein [Paraprevotella sp.]
MRLLIPLFFLLVSNMLYAQHIKEKVRTVTLSGCVRNVFTGYGESGAKVSVYDEDGEVVAPLCVLITYGSRDRNANEFRVSVPVGKYRIHVECEGYKPLDYWYEVKNIRRRQMIKLPDLMIQRDFSEDESEKVTQLREATVTATQVKIYYRGDTLVYNASAFKLPDGSMLDDLVRQLPGAEIKKNGDIYINGRKLDFLLLNGKEFFSGNNKVMLDNLPYYVIDKLKVYEEQSLRSQTLGHEVDAKLYVMDVQVKKEYSIGYFGNLEGAAGTHDRYLGRLFAMRFTDYSRLSFFGGSNNLNESRKPGTDTEWKPSENIDGTERRHNAGFDFLCEDKKESWKETANAIVTWTNAINEEKVFRERFLSDGNTFGRGHSFNDNRSLEVAANNNFTLKKPFFLDLKTAIQYQKNKQTGNSLYSAYNAHPDSMDTDTLNRQVDAWKKSDWKVQANQSAQFLRNLSNGDDLELEADASYDMSGGHDFSQYNLHYYNGAGSDDARHRYNDNQTHRYAYSGKILYRVNFSKDTKWELSYKYAQDGISEKHDKYRLDQIAGWWQQEPAIDLLPSNMEILKEVIDNDNTNDTHAQNKDHTFGTRMAMRLSKHTALNLKYSTDYLSQKYRYSSHELDSTIRRKSWLHSFNAEYIYTRKCRNRIFYYLYQRAPATMQLMPIRNTYNPLAVTVGNPSLKNQTNQGIANDFSTDFGTSRLLNFNNNLGARFFHNQVATAVSYNRTTGVYTYRPECANGNYRLFFYNSLGLRFRKLRQLTIHNNLNYDYIHNVDLYLPESGTKSIRSTVKTHQLTETFKASYDFGKIQLDWLTKVEFRYASSLQDNFKDIHATDVCYGLNLRYDMPWKLKFASDFKVYTRRGYDSKEMNTDDLVWNVSLSRAVLKGKLNFKVQGVDVLHNLHSVTYRLNGQGRTETWRRSIPNYWMVYVQWRFNKHPKRKD